MPLRPKIRIYCKEKLELGQSLFLSQDQVHYLFHVMRLTAGDYIALFNAQDGEFVSKILEINKKNVKVLFEENIRTGLNQAEMLNVVFICPVLKKDRFDFAIEKMTELGVTQIQPIQTEFSIAHQVNIQRLERQVVEASEQCERLDVPIVFDMKKLEVYLDGWPKQFLLFVACERQDDIPPLVQELSVWKSDKTSQIGFLVGPEGGFSKREHEMFKKYSFIKRVSLGDKILRSETAIIYLLSVFQAVLENHHD